MLVSFTSDDFDLHLGIKEPWWTSKPKGLEPAEGSVLARHICIQEAAKL